MTSVREPQRRKHKTPLLIEPADSEKQAERKPCATRIDTAKWATLVRYNHAHMAKGAEDDRESTLFARVTNTKAAIELGGSLPEAFSKCIRGSK